MDGVWTLEPSEEVCAPERVELTWTPERIECLTRLWEEGVTTAEIGRRIGVTKNAVIGKVHRIGLVPRVVKETPAPRRNVFDFAGPVCMWPIGHPTDNDFHFCGGAPIAGKPYCSNHAALAYIRPREKPEAA
jgi:GcrA cell cycle regulator